MKGALPAEEIFPTKPTPGDVVLLAERRLTTAFVEECGRIGASLGLEKPKQGIPQIRPLWRRDVNPTKQRGAGLVYRYFSMWAAIAQSRLQQEKGSDGSAGANPAADRRETH